MAISAKLVKQLRDKTAASKDYFVNLGGGGSSVEQTNVRSFFESQFDNANAASNGTIAAENIPGVYLDGTTKRLIAANGLEPQQIILKGLMGACFMDQVVNNYLSLAVLDESTNRADNTNKVLSTLASMVSCRPSSRWSRLIITNCFASIII